MARSDDPRLDVRATLLQPRVTYAELGAWVQRSTGVSILVSPTIQERKATVLVENRPVRETMDRVADALFVEWEPADRGGGYTLKLRKDVAAEEAATIAVLNDLRTRSLRSRLDELAGLAGRSPAEIQAMRDGAGEEPGLAASDLRARMDAAARNPAFAALGGVFAALGPAGRSRLSSGGRFFVSDVAGQGVIAMPAASIAGLKAGGLNAGGTMLPGISTGSYSRLPPEGSHIAAMLDGDLASGRVRVVVGFFDAKGSEGGYAMLLDGGQGNALQSARYDTPLSKRMQTWAKEEADVEVWRAAVGPSKRPTDPAPRHALAERLVDLHARTGLPIVADGFREAIWGTGTPGGTTVGEWTDAVNRPEAGRPTHPVLWRASHGWLMARRPFYPERLSAEIPEAVIRRLEAASAKPGGPTLEEAAAFAATLSSDQADHLDESDLVMAAPNAAFANNVAILRAWNALPEALRGRATAPGGLALASSNSAQAALMEALADRCAESGDASLLALLLPGASLSESPRLRSQRMERVTVLTIGYPEKTLAQYDVPLGTTSR